MQQIILSSQGALLARVPRPAVEAGSILVRVHYSLVSVGTELAPLRANTIAPEDGGVFGNVRTLARKAPYYAIKAIQNPGLTWRRTQGIASRKFASVKQRLLPAPRPQGGGAMAEPSLAPPDALTPPLREFTPVHWRREAARELEAKNATLLIRTNGQPGLYQAISQAVAVPPGHILKILVQGEIKGAQAVIGALSGDRSRWLNQLTVEDDFNEEIMIEAGNSGFVWLTWALSTVSDRTICEISVDSFVVGLEEKTPDTMSVNEMSDLGWGVGYSAAGDVIAVGDGVRDIKVGDVVACGGAGQANHAEYISVKQLLVTHVPDGCPADLAATTTVGAIALQGVRRTDPKLGDTVCVVGLGLLGLITCQMLKANGCKVLGLDPSEQRVSRALRLGVDQGATTPERFLELALHATAGHGADATVITAAAKTDALINHAMKTTRRKGRVVIVGDVGLAMERPELYRKEIDVLISTSYGPGRYDASYENDGLDYPYAYVRWTENRNMQAYLELIRNNRIDIRALIDEVVPLSEAPDAYRRLASPTDSAPVGVLISYPPTATAAPLPSSETQIRLGGHRKAKPGRLGYVLVGVGAFGTSMLVPQMDKRRDRFDLRGVVSRDAVRGGNYARQRQLEILATDLNEVVAREDIDLVVISTRHDKHAEQAATALRAGKHVFVEKPLALTWEQLDEVQQALEERPNGALLMVGFNRRFAPASETLRQALAGRVAPMIINYRLNGGFIPRDSWIQGNEGGGRNLGEACHMYDFFRSLTGAPVTSISATSIDPSHSNYLANDNFVATLTYADGSLATLVYSANGPKSGLPKERVEVFCDGKAYVLDNYVSVCEYPSGAKIWSSREGDKGHFEELSRFGDAIANGAESGPITIEEILETTAVSLHIEDLLQGRI